MKSDGRIMQPWPIDEATIRRGQVAAAKYDLSRATDTLCNTVDSIIDRVLTTSANIKELEKS